jgi:hypothetical protein
VNSEDEDEDDEEDGMRTFSSKNPSQRLEDTSFNIRSLNLRELRDEELIRNPKIKTQEVLHEFTKGGDRLSLRLLLA